MLTEQDVKQMRNKFNERARAIQTDIEVLNTAVSRKMMSYIDERVKSRYYKGDERLTITNTGKLADVRLTTLDKLELVAKHKLKRGLKTFLDNDYLDYEEIARETMSFYDEFSPFKSAHVKDNDCNTTLYIYLHQEDKS